MDNMILKLLEILVFFFMIDKEKVDWVIKVVVVVLDYLQVLKFDSLDEFLENKSFLDRDEFNINVMYNGEKFECVMCGNFYIKENWFWKYFKKKY